MHVPWHCRMHLTNPSADINHWISLQWITCSQRPSHQKEAIVLYRNASWEPCHLNSWINIAKSTSKIRPSHERLHKYLNISKGIYQIKTNETASEGSHRDLQTRTVMSVIQLKPINQLLQRPHQKFRTHSVQLHKSLNISAGPDHSHEWITGRQLYQHV